MNKIRALLATIGAIIALVLASAGPAYAAYGDCGTTSFCLWTSTDALGTRFQYSYTTILNGTHNGIRLPSGATNRGYSFYNRLGTSSGVSRDVAIIDAYNCNPSPWFRKMVNGQQATTQGSDWGGRVSSIQLYGAVNPSNPLLC